MSNIVIDDFVISYSAGNTKHTETTVRACIQSALSYEKKYDKTVIEFTTDEILSMMTDLHSISVGSLQNRILCLESFCEWYAKQLSHIKEHSTFEIYLVLLYKLNDESYSKKSY